MNMKKVLLAGAALVAATAAPANASIVDNPHFKVLGLVIVWGDNNVVNDFVINTDASGSNDADLIAGDVTPVVTGTLGAADGSLLSITGAVSGGAFTDNATLGTVGVLDANDSFTAFELDGTTDIGFTQSPFTSTWYAASNTAFNVSATVATTASGNLDDSDITYSFVAASAGANASDPTLPASGAETTATTLDAIDGTDVWTGNVRTASAAGSILSQGWSFTSTYTLDYDLSQGVGDVESTVTYTVYVP